ncbi:MAG: hypothetical protein WC455_20820 [Dehalococcoidia bacterium]|jgi:hypothetical protein
MYKIEGLVKGQWDSNNVDGGNSEYNRFETMEEAKAMIPQLMKDFGDEGATENDFRNESYH